MKLMNTGTVTNKWAVYKRHSAEVGRCICPICLEIEKWMSDRKQNNNSLEAVRAVYQEAKKHFDTNTSQLTAKERYELWEKSGRNKEYHRLVLGNGQIR